MNLSADFEARFGRAPTVVASAPGRVNLIGEHLDYNGGRCLPVPLTHRTTVAVAAREDGRLVVESRQQQGRVEVADVAQRPEGWAAYVAGVAWALELPGPGADVLVDGQVPVGSGLSSSAALEAAVALALLELVGVAVDREEVVAACVRAENDYVGAPTGRLDQSAALLSEPGAALLLDFATGEHRAVPWAPPAPVLIIDTRTTHALEGNEYGDRRRSCEEAAALLGVEHLVRADPAAAARLADDVLRRRTRHVLSEDARVGAAVRAAEDDDWAAFGAAMTASHASLRDDFEVSCAELDIAVEAALRAGALGARMTGGGFGGCAIALLPAGAEDVVRRSVAEAFSEHGWRAPGFLDGTAGEPARIHAGGSASPGQGRADGSTTFATTPANVVV